MASYSDFSAGIAIGFDHTGLTDASVQENTGNAEGRGSDFLKASPAGSTEQTVIIPAGATLSIPSTAGQVYASAGQLYASAAASATRKSGRLLKSGKRPLLAKKPEGKTSFKMETKPDIFKG